LIITCSDVAKYVLALGQNLPSQHLKPLCEREDSNTTIQLSERLIHLVMGLL